MSELVDAYLAQYSDQLETRACVIDPQAIEKSYPILRTYLPAGTWLVVADPNTWQAGGGQLAGVLEQAAQPWQHHLLNAPPGEDVICSDTTIAEVQQLLARGNFSAAIALGAGTLNDVVKMATHNLGMTMAVVGTAPSMNGYNSAIAAVLSEGVKTTQTCQAPRVVIADLKVMAQAPHRMIASGLGDLLSKPVSNSDWRLSARLLGTHHSPEAMEIIEHGARALDGVAARLPARDIQAVGGLVDSLILSGIAMSVAGSSSPASGGEHLISHYIDMTAYAFDQPHDLHGCQVGVGTLTTALFYENLRALDPKSIDIPARVAALPAWEAYEEELRARFGPLFDAVVPHARRGYPTPDALAARLTQLVAQWEVVQGEVAQTLRTRQSLEDELRRAHAPVRFKDLGVSRERARRAIVHAKDIRNRYTILHLAWELGLIDAWADAALEVLYE